MDDRFDRLEGKIDSLITTVDQKFAGVDQKFAGVETRLSERIEGLAGKVDSLTAHVTVQGKRLENVEQIARATATRVDAVSLQVAGVSTRVDRLSQRMDHLAKHQRRFATDVTKRLKKADAKAQITIEGHEAIRFEMHREFTTLRREMHNRVQTVRTRVAHRPSDRPSAAIFGCKSLTFLAKLNVHDRP